MNIGIILNSQTGHTLSIVEKLKEKLSEKGHSVTIDRVTAKGKIEPGKPVSLDAKPDPAGYDALVLAAPVMGFTLNPAMKAYLAEIGSIEGKKAACLVTQHLPYGWMGGNRAVRIMKRALNGKGAKVAGKAIVHWVNEEKRVQQAEKAVSTLSGLFE